MNKRKNDHFLKPTNSTNILTTGMQTTVNTSALLQHRIKECVPARMAAIQTAIKNKDVKETTFYGARLMRWVG